MDTSLLHLKLPGMVVEVSPDLNISSSTWPKQNQLQGTETEHTPVLHTKLEEKLIFTHSTFSNCPTSCTHTHTHGWQGSPTWCFLPLNRAPSAREDERCWEQNELSPELPVKLVPALHSCYKPTTVGESATEPKDARGRASQRKSSSSPA